MWEAEARITMSNGNPHAEEQDSRHQRNPNSQSQPPLKGGDEDGKESEFGEDTTWITTQRRQPHSPANIYPGFHGRWHNRMPTACSGVE
jgi:hypothetical protein